MRSTSNGFTSIFYAIGAIFFTFINIWITEYRDIYLFQAMTMIISTVGLLFFCKSPFFLHEKGKYKSMFKALHHIAKWNHRAKIAESLENHFTELHSKINVEEEKLNSITLSHKSEYLEDPIESKFDSRKLKLAIGFVIIAANIYLGYGMSLLVTQKIGINNVYVNGCLFGASELLGAIITIMIAAKVQRRLLNIANSLVTIQAALLLLVLRGIGLGHDSFGQLLESLLSVTIKLLLCINLNMIFTYAAELFHTKQRGIVIGITVFVGNIMLGLAVYLDMLADNWGVHPMVMLSFGAVVSFIVSSLMPETLFVKLGN